MNYNNRGRGNVTQLKRDAWRVDAAYQLGAHTFGIQYGMGKIEGDDCRRQLQRRRPGTDAWIFGYAYSLSKRSSVFAYYTRVDNDTNARASGIVFNGIGPNAGGDPSVRRRRPPASVLARNLRFETGAFGRPFFLVRQPGRTRSEVRVLYIPRAIPSAARARAQRERYGPASLRHRADPRRPELVHPPEEPRVGRLESGPVDESEHVGILGIDPRDRDPSQPNRGK